MRDDSQSGQSNLTCQALLRTTGGTASAMVIGACTGEGPASAAGQNAPPAARAEEPNIPGALAITLRINGKERSHRIDPGRRSSIAFVRS